jgi:hypothetical protein
LGREGAALFEIDLKNCLLRFDLKKLDKIATIDRVMIPVAARMGFDVERFD